MAPISPGFQLAPSRKAKKKTTSTNLHRFETFSQRIAKLKIDPVHTVEKRRPSNDDKDLLQSYFRTALEEWAELNLSQTFTSFFNKVNTLCENLPQLIYHADPIFDALAEHIDKRDEIALEPLLSLLAHLAHDLGQVFEKYFSRTVELVADVAATQENAEVIEWCFTCLAWMFKYLAKLLVNDLRPLLDIMSPYLSSKKDHIVRFSAESLAFLLRKAAVLYQKKRGPLTLAIQRLVTAFPQDKTYPPYNSHQLGFMSLCVDSARGLDGQLHSCSASLVGCLLEIAISTTDQPQVLAAIEGVLIALIHETSAATFRPIQEIVLERVRDCSTSSMTSQVSFAVRILVVVLGTRNASRLSDWGGVMDTFQTTAAVAWKLAPEAPDLNTAMATVAAEVIQFAPMQHLLPITQKLLDSLAQHLSAREFFAFSTLCAELGAERFDDLVLPALRRYITKNWLNDEVSLYYVLERRREQNALDKGKPAPASLSCPTDYATFAISQLSTERSIRDITSVQKHAGRLRLGQNTRYFENSENLSRALDILRSLLAGAFEDPACEVGLRRRIALGWGLESYLDILPEDSNDLEGLLSLAQKSPPACFRMPSFVHQLNRLIRKQNGALAVDRSSENTRNLLLRNLLSPSSLLKRESIELLIPLDSLETKSCLVESTRLMLEILDTPYSPSETRKIAMLLRRLPQLQQSIPLESSYHDLIPFFCLGLLSSYHDQTRKEACAILAQLAKTSLTEETIINVAMEWLQTAVHPMQSRHKPKEETRRHLSSFECSSLVRIESLSSSVQDDFQHSDERFLSFVEAAHRLENVGAPPNGRALAIQILSAMPASAERRSRLLMPIFLAAPFSRGHLPAKSESDASVSSHTLTPDIDEHDWSLADRKALLALLSKFVNPRVLFKSTEVYDKLIDILSNGNEDIRKLALQAVLSWKDPAIIRYEAKLLELAEGKLATSEISALLSSDDQAESIKSPDRETTLPIAIRLVYGTIVGRAGTSGSQDSRRKSLLRILFRLSKSEVSVFLDVALGRLRDVKVSEASSHLASLDHVSVPGDHQYGFLRLLLSTLETLQSQFADYGKQIVDAVVACVIKASHQGHSVINPAATSALDRNIRRTGLQCLILLFEHCPDISWPQYLPLLFSRAISPRLDIFASEITEGISGLLRLFAVWAHSHASVEYLVQYDHRIPPTLCQALSAPATPSAVKIFMLDEVILPWIELADDSSAASNQAQALLEAGSNDILQALVSLLERTPSKDILASVTAILPRLAPLTHDSDSRASAVKLLADVLCNAGLRIPPNVKGQLLRSIQRFLSGEGELDEELRWQLLSSVSPLFNYFKDEDNRQILCHVLARLTASGEISIEVAQICHDLNATSSERLGEVDYDKRLHAFQSASSLPICEYTEACSPILYNLLFFVRTGDDFVIRSNAMESLKQVILKGCTAEQAESSNLILAIVLPIAKRCIRDESELIRADFVNILGLLVQNAGDNEDLANMTPLLVGNDQEASFFSNILHIQQHRRFRAIRRLVTEVERGAISTKNIAEIFIPLLEMFIQDSSTDESAQSTRGQAITAMGTLLQWLDWKQFKTLFRKYKGDIDLTDSQHKESSRLLGHATDALISASKWRVYQDGESNDQPKPRLAEALPDKKKVEQELRTQFIPHLAELIHYKDEAEISSRLPIAVITVKLITLLPAPEIASVASPVVLDIANILRSRTQESRDAARKALCELVLLLGPSSLQFVVKEMRTALTRGYQLHVVSYTLHAILVALSTSSQHGDLDYCVEDLVPVIMDDIFGTVGQEKDNQDYISSMKEVKSSKSFDSMELLARSIRITSVSKLIAPLQTFLSGSLTSKQVRQVDELLRRTGSGVAQNPSANKRDILTFAYQLIQALYEQKSSKGGRTQTTDEKNRQRYLIQLSSAQKRNESQALSLLYKLAKFSLDLVRSTLQKYGDILTPENVHGFLPVIGDALIEGQEDVKISALRLLSAIIKLPMQELEENASLYIGEAVKLVKKSTSTNEEGAQAALKLIAAVLRERKHVTIRESDVAELLRRLTPDIEEPDRQGVTFNFIRAVMARKIQIPEVYELADKIGIMMVTNHGKGARDVARGVFVHFLLEYPQTSSRWSKQQKFLLKNLEYEYPEGRQCVMEAINTLVAKMRGESAQELVSTCFIPVLLRMANDDNEACRQLAGAFLGKLFSKADRGRLGEMFEPLNAWAEQEENPTLRKLSLQAFIILLDTDVALKDDELAQIRDSIYPTLKLSNDVDEDEWELPFQALSLLLKLTESHPEAVLDRKQSRLWSSVWSSFAHPNAWIRSTVASLCVQFFSHCVLANTSNLPLTCDLGLSMDSDAFLTVLKASIRVLQHTEGNENLSEQVVQMLGFLGQCLDQNGLSIPVKQLKSTDNDDMEDDDSEDDSGNETAIKDKISGIQYLLDQLTRILRVEPNRLTTSAFLPKKSTLHLLSTLLPSLSSTNTPPSQIHTLLLPIHHLTDPSTISPRSADPTFATTYQSLIELAHEVTEKIQTRLGDAEYVKALTEVSRMVRKRREERRSKRVIERVAEPERAAREKKRKHDRTRERKREMGRAHQRRRREVG